jgi:cobalt-zinc-cadmium efflux system outer membrane protein
MRSVFSHYWPLALTAMFAWAGVATAGPTILSLQQAVQESLENNPGLAATAARAEGLAQMPQQMDALPDPRLSINALNLPLNTFSLSQEAMTQIQVGISQDLPYPGKLGLRSQAASLDAQAAGLDVNERENRLREQVKTTWWRLFYFDRALENLEQNKVLLRQIVDIAKTRYQVGQGQQQEFLMAELELSKLMDQAIQIRAMREHEAARLNALMGREDNVAIQLPQDVDVTLVTLLDEAMLLQRTFDLRPELKARRHRMEAAQARVNLAQKDLSPDFKVGAAYGWRDGHNPNGSKRADLGSILFSMNLPLYSDRKQAKAVDQRRAEWMQQKHLLQDIRNRISSQLRQSISSYEGAKQQTLLYRDSIIPQAHQTMDAMLAGYQVGKVGFQGLMQSQAALYNYETQNWHVFTSAQQALARIQATVGEEKVYE